MKSSPLKNLQLSVLFVAIISSVSCSKGHDLMAEYVVSATLSPNDLGMSTKDDFEGTYPKGSGISDTFPEEAGTGEIRYTEATSATTSTVEIDDVTNTIIYTPAVENLIRQTK